MKKIRYPLLASAIAATLLGAHPAIAAAPGKSASSAAHLSEAQKIEALISSVGGLKGAVFIRNGSEYDAAQAAEHLHRKLDYAGKRIHTAQQFIDKLATGSSMTGKPYKIRFADGRTVESAVYFREQLRKLEAAPPQAVSKG
jgi:hypothetical protein